MHSFILSNEKQALVEGLVQYCCFVCWLGVSFSLTHISAYVAAKTQERNIFLKNLPFLWQLCNLNLHRKLGTNVSGFKNHIFILII